MAAGVRRVQGCGIVEFERPEEAATAITHLHLSEVRPLRAPSNALRPAALYESALADPLILPVTCVSADVHLPPPQLRIPLLCSS